MARALQSLVVVALAALPYLSSGAHGAPKVVSSFAQDLKVPQVLANEDTEGNEEEDVEEDSAEAVVSSTLLGVDMNDSSTEET